MSRILLLTQVLPYPVDAGPKVRAYYMLRHLAGAHQVTLVSFVRPDDRAEAVEHLRSLCHAVYAVPMRRSVWRNLRAVLKGLLTGLPIVVARDDVAEMETTLRRLARAQRFDVVHADQLSMAGYGRLAARVASAGTARPRALLDEHNAIYLLTRRMAAGEPSVLRRSIMQREAKAFARYEASMCRAYDALLTVTAEDRDRLLALFQPEERSTIAEKLTVVPICVDPVAVQPVARADGGPPSILHLGTMFWPPNVAGVLWFAREVLPLVRQQIPEARLVIVGKNPPSDVTALAADPRIEVTGYVADPTPHLAAAGVFIVPLHAGGGMRVKILDAWLWGLPVVTTPIGAEGIAVRDGENLLIAGDARAFAAATVRLLSDGELNRRLRTAGRAWVEATYAWHKVYHRVDEVYAGLLQVSAPQHG
jgi:glycosyltransferase involved in cell wall biosynthesis